MLRALNIPVFYAKTCSGKMFVFPYDMELDKRTLMSHANIERPDQHMHFAQSD